MDTRKVATQYRLSHWAQFIRERKESGLSIKAFCEKTGVHQNTYYYWQRRVREAACHELAVQEQDSKKTPVPSGWALCEPADKPEPTVSSVITVEVGSFKVSVDENFNPDLLTKVCRTLVSVC
jgi:transposase-like protein